MVNWLLDYNQSGIYILIGIIIIFISVIGLFIYKEVYLTWKNDYYRDKDILMRPQTLKERIFRSFL